jgi:hypothetical protein
MPEIFVSHAATDRDYAEQLSDAPRRSGLSIWTDAAVLKPGDDWGDYLRRAIRGSSAIILLATSDATRSVGAMTEVGAAFVAGKPMIAVVPPGRRAPAELPAELQGASAIQARNPIVEQVAAEVRERLSDVIAMLAWSSPVFTSSEWP